MDADKRNNIISITFVVLTILAVIIGIIISSNKDPNKDDIKADISLSDEDSQPQNTTAEPKATSTSSSVDTTIPDTESKPSDSTKTNDNVDADPIDEQIMYSWGANFRQSPDLSSKILSYLPLNAEIKVIGTDGEWYICEVDGVQGYVHSTVLSKTKITSNTDNESKPNTDTQSTNQNDSTTVQGTDADSRASQSDNSTE